MLTKSPAVANTDPKVRYIGRVDNPPKYHSARPYRRIGIRHCPDLNTTYYLLAFRKRLTVLSSRSNQKLIPVSFVKHTTAFRHQTQLMLLMPQGPMSTSSP